ncbi:LuxR C-terminal-related transcriptional regulator [Arcanobacterium canis]
MLFLFFYTMIVFVCSLFISAVSFSAFVVTRRKMFALAAAAFMFYFFDVGLVFRTAYAQPNCSVQTMFTITSPLESVFLGAGVFGCLWAMACRFVEVSMRPAKIAVGVFVVGSAVTYFGMSNPRDREFAFFTMRSLMILALVVFGAWVFIRTVDRLERRRLLTHLPLALGMLAGSLGTLVWNIYFLYIRPALKDAGAPAFMPERNFVENALILGIGFWFVRAAVRRLALFYEHTPEQPTPAREKFLESGVRAFAQRFSLSERESEILTEIVRAKTYSAIASQLFISPSTVKVHVHNILKKTSQPDRDALVREFWHGV